VIPYVTTIKRVLAFAPVTSKALHNEHWKSLPNLDGMKFVTLVSKVRPHAGHSARTFMISPQ
jgi:hypothetical protein